MIAHDWDTVKLVCRRCRTTWALHIKKEQPCVPAPRPEPARRALASEDCDAIRGRMAVLEAERQAIRNRPAEAD